MLLDVRMLPGWEIAKHNFAFVVMNKSQHFSDLQSDGLTNAQCNSQIPAWIRSIHMSLQKRSLFDGVNKNTCIGDFVQTESYATLQGLHVIAARPVIS